ncbi:MAG: peptidase E [Alphaproteobacteria bacterium]|nr:peptidase E [Alphaproteobacteria bacterium]
MKLYLSSFKLGDRVDYLKAWQHAHNNKIAVIPNAIDYRDDPDGIEERILANINDLTNIGFDAVKLDLKDYFGKQKELEDYLKAFSACYVSGGNTYVLRRAMALSGFDELLKNKMNNRDFLYAGYSAGICVLADKLDGISVMDVPEADPYNYGSIIHEGVGLLDFMPIPHYQSDHFETELADKAVEYCKQHGIIYKTMQDGDVIII